MRLLWGRNPGELEIVVFLMAERIKAPHRKAGIFQRQRQRWQVRLGTKKGNSFLMEGKWGHPISLQSLLLTELRSREAPPLRKSENSAKDTLPRFMSIFKASRRVKRNLCFS